MKANTLRPLVLFLVLTAGCAFDVLDPDAESIRATVRLLNIEIGCWVLETRAGKRYEPLGLPPAFRRDGLQVSVTVRPRTDVGSFCMVGEIVEVIAIRER